jgi:hypothetical protein
MTTTQIRNCRSAIVWDEEIKSHVYRSGVDVVMVKDRIAFIGEKYDGESDRVMDGANWLVTPGLMIDGVQVVRDQKVLTIDYDAASAALEEAQARGLSRIRQLDWAGRSADEIAGSAFPRR